MSPDHQITVSLGKCARQGARSLPARGGHNPRWSADTTRTLSGGQARRGSYPPLDKDGGAKGSRTPDLLNAIQALSQLSYGPVQAGGGI